MLGKSFEIGLEAPRRQPVELRKQGVGVRKRKQRRIALTRYFAVDNLVSGERIGFLANITTGGAMVLADTSADLDDRRLLPLHLTVQHATGELSLCFTARRAWTKSDPATGLHATGFEFEGLTEATRREIQDLIRVYGSRLDTGRRWMDWRTVVRD